MIHKLTQAKRLVEAFIALMVGRKARVHWDDRSSMDSTGGIHLPAPKTGDAAEIALLTRIAVHETGHLLETQQGFADRLTQEELTIFNCLEDPRMEKRQVQRYPGASLVLSRGLDELLQRMEDRLDETVAALPERAVHLDMLMRGFLAVAPHGPFARRAPAILQRVSAHIDEAQRTAIDEALAGLPAFATSLDAEEAARTFLARLRELQPPQPQESGGEQQEQQEQQPDQQQPESQPGKQQEQQGQEPPSEPDAANADEPEQGPSNDGGSSDDGGEQQPEGGDAQGGSGADTGNQDQQSGGADGNDDQASSDAAAGGEPGGDRGDAGNDAESSGSSESSTPSSNHANDGQPTEGGAAEAGEGGDTQSSGADAGDTQSSGGASRGAAESQAEPSDSGQAQGAQAAHEDAQPQQAGGDFDLGQLLREAYVSRYGASQPARETVAAEEAATELSDEELQRVRALLAQPDPSGSLEELVEASLAALAAGESSENGDAGEAVIEGVSQGAGMSLASAPTGPTPLIEARLQGVQSRLVTVLQRELQDKRRRPTRAAYGGRVMPQRVWRLGAMGDTKVFVRRQPAGGIEAAATVLLDSSESMGDDLTVAAEVTMAFSLALQRLGVRTRVARFPGAETVTETIQRFGEPARACVHRCAELVADGGTPIGAAVALETPALLEQRKLKNVLAVVTDDQPGDKAALAAALERAHELDILVVGVGIGCDIRMWIPNSVSVQSVNELPDALARLFRENITEKLAA